MGLPAARAPGRARAWFRGFDLSDEALTRLTRARLMGGFGLVVVLISAALPFTGMVGMPAQPLALPLLVVQLVVSVLALWRGERLGDRQYVAASLVALAAGTPVLIMSTAPGSLRNPELTMLAPLAMGAVFATTRLQATLVVLAAIASSAAVSAHRIPDVAEARAQVVGQLICLGLLGVVVRWLRESAATAVAAARLGEVTDPLTALLNRRGFQRDGVAAWDRARTARTPLTLALLDLDHFKAVNDVLGHAGGDAVLREVGATLQACTRAEDVVVRLGGEEFAVLGATEPGHGFAVGERLRLALDQAISPITVSVGIVEIPVAALDAAADDALWRTVAAADAAMYEAKHTGRDRVVVRTA
jgi:diguanylate cyclase (GGDEF)-like protein